MINQLEWEDHVVRTCQDGHLTELPVLVNSLYMEDVREIKTDLGARQSVRSTSSPTSRTAVGANIAFEGVAELDRIGVWQLVKEMYQ